MGACSTKSSAATDQTVVVAKTETLPTQSRCALTLSDINDLSVSSESVKRPIKWQKGDLIGEGTYAQVYQCLSDDGELLAVKTIPFGKNGKEVAKGLDKAKKEIKLLRQLSHPNIVKYLQTEVSEKGDSVHILMEYVSGGSLKTLVKRYAMDEVILRHYSEQILQGLAYLHENRIIHRDLKGANILLAPDGTIKLTDFGSSTYQLGTDELCLSMKGSPYWMAPEVVSRLGHTTKADIWSFGCILIEIKTGSPPWSDESGDTRGVLKLISTADRLPHFPEGSEDFLSLLRLCLNREPDQRPEAKDLLQHAFFVKSSSPGRTTEEPRP